jgi:hypothetical protein
MSDSKNDEYRDRVKKADDGRSRELNNNERGRIHINKEEKKKK